jgi:hypothetical protein
VAESDGPDDLDESASGQDGLGADLANGDDDQPMPETGLGAIGQFLAALAAVALLGLLLLGAAAVVTRLMR